jgi:predicted amidohydrolase YtcJ
MDPDTWFSAVGEEPMKVNAVVSLVVPLATLLVAACGTPQPPVIADAIYFGGPIVTVNDAQPTAEALAVKDGKILAVGPQSRLEQSHQGAATTLIDLGGRTLAPGFVDGHVHFLGLGAQAVGANLLAPPDGGIHTIEDVVARLREFANGPDAERTGWIFGMGYDDALLGRHPNRDDLDKVSTDTPVMAVHISGHFSAVNSAGLRKIGYTAATADPEGGLIRRRPGSSEPSGVLEELASIPSMIAAVSPATQADKDYYAARALALAKSFGYTTIGEGRAFASNHLDLVSFATRGLLDIDVMSYIDYVDRGALAPESFSRSYTNRYRVAGLKVTLDGSPQGRTAWRTTPYVIPPEGQNPGYTGYPAIPDSQLVASLLDEAYEKRWPVHVHANGDAAIDQMLEAVRLAQQKHGPGDRRTTLIHGQFLRQDQIPILKELEIFPSLFAMHTFYWGDWYETIIGPEHAQQISPLRSVLDAGLIANSHTDAPVALPNLMQVMWATVNRVSRSGRVIGPGERLAPMEALKAITLWGAYGHFEEEAKGSLVPGKLADMVILSDNPITIDPMKINEIQVLETIKEGATVYTRGD